MREIEHWILETLKVAHKPTVKKLAIQTGYTHNQVRYVLSKFGKNKKTGQQQC